MPEHMKMFYSIVFARRADNMFKIFMDIEGVLRSKTLLSSTLRPKWIKLYEFAREIIWP